MLDDLKVSDMIKIAISIIQTIVLLILVLHFTEVKEYKLIYETKQEIMITDGEDIITIEKEETKGGNKEW